MCQQKVSLLRLSGSGMMKKLAAISVFFLFLVSWAFSQDTEHVVSSEGDSITTPLKPVKNAVKTDLLAWFVNVGVLKYERVLSEKVSAQLGFYYSWDFPAYDEGYTATGFSVTVELRYFLLDKKPAPRGLYLAPNYRYQKLETENLWESSQASIINNSIAINLGYQLILKDLFLIEAWAGIVYNFRKVTEETVPGANIGYPSESGFGGRFGIAVGLAF